MLDYLDGLVHEKVDDEVDYVVVVEADDVVDMGMDVDYDHMD
jgi:hypothetical protein